MQKIVPNIWFNKNAAEAGEFYTQVFPNTTSKVTSSYPTENLPDFQRTSRGNPSRSN